MEAIIPSSDSENRITIGGKRKSSGRRSSILKGSKSPLKTGALEELDPNSLDNDSRSKSKKSRQSSGRRVSFAEKNEIKEFFVEDWQAAWKKEVEQNNLQTANNPSQSEYREPAKSIQGIDTLLKGNIQDENIPLYELGGNQIMPEAQFGQTSEVHTDQIKKCESCPFVDTSEVVKTPGTANITLCKGVTVNATDSLFSTAKPRSSSPQMIEEMEHTICIDSNQPLLDKFTAADSGDQTMIFESDAAVELDITCTSKEQEVLFCDNPGAPLSSSINSEEAGKMDSTAFLMSLKATPSINNPTSTQKEIEMSDKTDCRPLLISSKSNISISENSEVLPFKDNTAYSDKVGISCPRKPLGEITDVRSSSEGTQHVGWNGAYLLEEEPLCDDLELTTCQSYGPLDRTMQKTKRRSIYEASCMDITSCFSPGFVNSSEQQDTSKKTSYTGRSLGATCSSSYITCTSSEIETSCLVGEKTTDHNKEDVEGQTSHLNMTCCYGRGILPKKSLLGSVTDQTLVYGTKGENADPLDLTVCQGEGVFTRNMDSSAFLQTLDGVRDVYVNCSTMNVSDQMDGEMDLTAVHGSATFQAAQTTTLIEENAGPLNEPVNQLDITNCYGNGILANDLASSDTAEVRSAGPGHTDILDFTVCRGRSFSTSTQHTRQGKLPGSDAANKVDSLVFLRSLCEGRGPDCNDVDKVSSEMDITATTEASLCVENGGHRFGHNRMFNLVADKTLRLKDYNESNISLASNEIAIIDSQNRHSLKGATWNQAAEITIHSHGNDFSDDNDLELTSCHSYKVIDHKMQKLKRRSIYDVTDIEVTSCFGPGWAKLQDKKPTGSNIVDILEHSGSAKDFTHANKLLIKGNNLARHGIQQQSDKAKTESIAACGNQGNPGFEAQRRCILDPIPLSMPVSTRETSGKNDSKCLLQSSKSTPQESEVLSHTSGNNSLENSKVTVEESGTVCASPEGWNRNQKEEVNLELTTCHSLGGLDISSNKTKRKSIYECSEMEITSGYGQGLVTSPLASAAIKRASLTSFETRCQGDIATSCVNETTDINTTQHLQSKKMAEQLEASGVGMKVIFCSHKSNDYSIEKGDSVEAEAGEDSSYIPQQIKSPFKWVMCDGAQTNMNVTRCQEASVQRLSENTTQHSQISEIAENASTLNQWQQMPSPFKPVTCDREKANINQTRCKEAIMDGLNETSALSAMQHSKVQDILGELQASRLKFTAPCANHTEFDSNAEKVHSESFHKQYGEEWNFSFGSETVSMPDEQDVSGFGSDGHKLSTIKEVEDGDKTEVDKSKNVTQEVRPITVEEFLNITETVFMTDVCTRRSIAPFVSMNSAQTTKDILVSSLVSAPKIACYEEAFLSIESQIKEIKAKVEQQKMELNSSNPRLFMEAQSASKKELLTMRTDARRLRCSCEDLAAHEWKEKKYKLNKAILSKIKENHQGLATDVYVIEESLAIVDNCLKLVDKVDKDLDQESKNVELCLQDCEKKLEEQAKVTDELQTVTKTVQESEEELTELASKQSSLQNEKEKLQDKKLELEKMIIEKEEELRLIKLYNQQDQVPSHPIKATFNLIESIQEWNLEEWDESRAKFTFFMKTVELVALFGPLPDGKGTKDSWEQTVESIQLNYAAPENINSYQRKVHTVLKRSICRARLMEMCPTKAGLTKVLEDMSFLMFKAKCVGDEIYKICLGHLATFTEDKFLVEFVSAKAFVKFLLDIQFDALLYPEGLSFTAHLKIGRVSKAKIEEALKAVKFGPFYLSRLVQTADELLDANLAPLK